MKAKIFGLLAASLLLSGQAGAAAVVCGNSSLGLRTTTVDPALAGSCYAGLQNLGDPDLVALVNTQYGITDATILNRDTANTNGGLLSITGVGLGSGTWSFDSSVWSTNQRIFLYFHFGDGPDSGEPGSTTDPEVFIVELVRADSSGTWTHFDGTDDGKTKYGLSNIALVRGGTYPECLPGTPGCNQEVPEPGSLALLGLGLLGLGLSRRRKA